MASTGEAGRGRRPELDGLRGVAILMVLVGHAFPHLTALASAGVTLFFALSGYLITGLLLAEVARDGRTNLPRFYWRRSTRLMPPLVVMLVVTTILARPTLTEVLPVATWTANYTRIAGLDAGIYGHAWSLAVEEQFYLLWPLLLTVLLVGRRTVPLLLGAVVAAWSWRAFLTFSGDAWYAYSALETAAVPMLGGCLVAVAGWTLGRWASTAATVVLLVSVALTAGPVLWMLTPLVAAPASVVLVASAASIPALAWRPLRWLGVASYSLYLWHEPVSHLFDVPRPVAVLLGVVAGALAWRLVELPLMRWRSGGSVVAARAADPTRSLA